MGTVEQRKRAKETGVALLVALFVLLLLSAMAATMSVRLMSETQASVSYRSAAQSYYSALAGLEEARARLVRSAPDAIPSASLPAASNEVLYIVNSTLEDPVVPNDPQSLYFDSNYLLEFSAGGAVTLLDSNQPNAQTPFAIPYKWVRITMKTEFSSQQDVNQDGILDNSTPVLFDGSRQQLASAGAEGWVVYKLTALAVEPSGARRLLQSEVASQRWITPLAGVAGADRVDLGGKLTVSGLNNCGAGADLYAVVSADEVRLNGGATAVGLPSSHLEGATLPAPSPAELVGQLTPFAIPIQDADPANISFDSGSQTYSGSWAALGDMSQFPPSESYPAVPAVIYADRSVSLDHSQGAGILLVDGDLEIQGTFKYYGLVVATGAVELAASNLDPVQIYGGIFQGGRLDANSSGAGQGIEILYDNCALTVATEPLPKTVLAFKDLGP
ncbi:MAG: hypothetical protein ACE5IP_00920 [Terriglobia bacterium]